MKKILVFALFVMGITTISAQVTFRPGVRAGVNFSHFTEGDSYYESYYNDVTGEYYSVEQKDEFKSLTSFYVGFFGDLNLSRYYSLQPEITFSQQGAEFNYYDGYTGNKETGELKVSYLSFAIVNKFKFNKFNFHLGPTLEFVVDDNFDTEAGVDFDFFLGAGYNFTDNFGIEARVKKGIVPVIDTNDTHTNVVFSVGATYKFDIK